MFRYETHLHTFPVSKCAKSTVREALEFYRALSYDGVVITNHFVNNNINIDRTLPYAEKLEFFISDYEEALRLSEEIGIKVFYGIEIGHGGSDFLVYGLTPDWYRAHPEMMEMKFSECLASLKEAGALVIHAHPFRDSSYIDHIRLFPRVTEGVEIFNAGRTPFENEMARQYAQNYEMLPFAGSDNHRAAEKPILGGMEGETPAESIEDFVRMVRSGELKPFRLDNPFISKENDE